LATDLIGLEGIFQGDAAPLETDTAVKLELSCFHLKRFDLDGDPVGHISECLAVSSHVLFITGNQDGSDTVSLLDGTSGLGPVFRGTLEALPLSSNGVEVSLGTRCAYGRLDSVGIGSMGTLITVISLRVSVVSNRALLPVARVQALGSLVLGGFSIWTPFARVTS